MLTPETQKDVIPFENNKKKSCDPLRRGGRESRRRDGRIGLRQWTLTGDFTVTSLVNNGTIIFNGCTITLADGTVMQ